MKQESCARRRKGDIGALDQHELDHHAEGSDGECSRARGILSKARCLKGKHQSEAVLGHHDVRLVHSVRNVFLMWHAGTDWSFLLFSTWSFRVASQHKQ